MDPDGDTQRELKEYLEQHKIHDLFTKIVEELLKNRPSNPLQTIADYLSSEFNVRAATDRDARPTEVIEAYNDSGSESSEDEEEGDVAEMVEMPARKTNAGRRTSVSAGVISLSDAKKSPVFEKSDDEKAKILAALHEIALFKQCDKAALDTIVLAFEKCSFEEGQVIIKEGDTVAEHFFLLCAGTAEALKGETPVKQYSEGESFGELALLYNQPRAATVKATSAVQAWRLDQTTFKTIVVLGVIDKRQKYIDFLKRCSLMQTLSELELMTLADSLERREYSSGDTIITQGDVGQDFFVVESGQVQCIKDGEPVLLLTSGNYFGEIALLYNQPRQASVVVESNQAAVLAIDRKTFQRLMGPLGEILKRNPLHQEFLAVANS